MTLLEAINYVGLNYDELDDELCAAYDETYEELMQFVEFYNRD